MGHSRKVLIESNRSASSNLASSAKFYINLKTMKKLFQIFFMFLGVIFFILILAGIYLYVADPFEIKPLIKIFTSSSSQPTTSNTKLNNTIPQTQGTIDKNPLLSPTQEKTLEKIGVDPSSLPSSITPAMEKCFYEKLGTKRAEEIKNGSEPTASDYFIARSCL